MNSLFAVLFLAAVCFCSTQVAETKVGKATEKQIFRPGNPIFFPFGNPVNTATATPAVLTAAPVNTVPVNTVPVTSSNLPACPGRCCKKYCLNGNFCKAAVAPAMTPTCDPTTTTFQRCVNTLSQGCATSVCTPAANCLNECGNILKIAPIAICP